MFDASGRIVYNRSGVSVGTYDGTSTTFVSYTYQNDNSEMKFGVAYGSGNKSLRLDSGSWVDGSYDGNYNSVNGDIRLLTRNDNVLNTALKPCRIRNVQRWDLAYADAKAKIDELMS